MLATRWIVPYSETGPILIVQRALSIKRARKFARGTVLNLVLMISLNANFMSTLNEVPFPARIALSLETMKISCALRRSISNARRAPQHPLSRAAQNLQETARLVRNIAQNRYEFLACWGDKARDGHREELL